MSFMFFSVIPLPYPQSVLMSLPSEYLCVLCAPCSQWLSRPRHHQLLPPHRPPNASDQSFGSGSWITVPVLHLLKPLRRGFPLALGYRPNCVTRSRRLGSSLLRRVTSVSECLPRALLLIGIASSHLRPLSPF